jgi:hypothetical protein
MHVDPSLGRTRRTRPLTPPPLVLFPWLGAAAVAGLVLARFGPAAAVALVLVLGIIGLVAAYPAAGPWMMIAVTPLVVGLSRGAAVPALRPNEALLLLVGAGLAVRILLVPAERYRLRPSSIDWAILTMAVTSSVIPLVWMRLRGWQIAHDDVLYSLMIWKLYIVYVVFRLSVARERDVRVCLWLSLASASLVAALGIFQALDVAGVRHFLATHYASYDNGAAAVASNRGGSTLGLPISAADLLVINFAIALGMIRIGSRHTRLLAGLAALFTVGVLAAGEISGFIGFCVALVAITLITGKRAYLGRVLLVAPFAMIAVWPVIQNRLQGFGSSGGLPVSWQGRLHNLETYFWPRLFSGDSWVMGLRPAARVIVPSQITGYVWIESGYTWLLWAGGLPLLLAYAYFVVVAVRHNRAVMRVRHDTVAVAAAAVVVALCFMSVLMVIDPHITYRGSADLMFALLGMTSAGGLRARRWPAGRT